MISVSKLGTHQLSNLAEERGLTLETKPIIAKAKIPDREHDCVTFSYPPTFQELFPVMTKVKSRILESKIKGRFNTRSGPTVREQWAKFADDNTDLSVISLGFFCDYV